MAKLVFRSTCFWSFDSKRWTIFGWILPRTEILKNKNTSPCGQNNCHSAVSVPAHPMSKAQHCTGSFAIRSPVLFVILCHIINLPSIILRKNAPTVAGRFWHWVRGYRYSAVAIILPARAYVFVFQDFYAWQCSAKSCPSFGIKRPKNMDLKTSFAINQICIIDKLFLIGMSHQFSCEICRSG